MSETPLFQGADEQEARYAGEAPERVAADEQSALSPPTSEQGDTPAAVPVGTGGSSVPAAPASDAFEPGMEREERDAATQESGVLGPDLRDEREEPPTR